MIIPAPKAFEKKDGCYLLADEVKVQSDFPLPLLENEVTFCETSDIRIVRDETVAKEGYRVSVTPESITVSASAPIGAYYALQSLCQLSGYDLGEREIPCCEIDDAPRFSWRGLQLDESRHFFGMDTVKRLLDTMFAQKLNVFHWHLTDDQGWRIEIKKYPLLTEIGSQREYTYTGGWNSFKMERAPYGGYYTQEQIKEIVAYAWERGIMVVPEIDFPAHCASAMAAYPYLSCFENVKEVPGYFGGIVPQWKYFDWRWNKTVCCGKESTFRFIFDVLDEVCELFDAPYLHMGGDEAPQGEWKHCQKCQALMRQHHLKNESELQGWFENEVCRYLKTKGRKLIAWNDVLKADNLHTEDKDLVIQYWTPKRDKRAEDYINSGGTAIMSNHQAFYFDMPYAMYPLTNTYHYRPEDFGINSRNIDNILGVEGELWSEWIPDSDKLEMLAFPRVQALSEVAWSPKEKRDFDDFKRRWNAYKPVLEQKGIHYAVDKISLPKDRGARNNICRKFRRGNPYLEVELNKDYKAKGEK